MFPSPLAVDISQRLDHIETLRLIETFTVTLVRNHLLRDDIPVLCRSARGARLRATWNRRHQPCNPRIHIVMIE